MLKIVSDAVFEYETMKMVQISSKKIGAIFRLAQVLILVYFIGWVMIYQRGYQDTDTAISGVTAKLKGVSYIQLKKINPKLHNRVFDVAKYVIPPQQNSAFFVLTNMIVTPNQTLGKCDEGQDIYNVDCKQDTDCVEGNLVMLGNGRMTGRCVNSTQKLDEKVCEIFGWCPTELDKLPSTEYGLVDNARNFTVLIKNSIEFPVYQVRRRNILPWMTKTFLYTCRHNGSHPRDKYCPIFRLGNILDEAGENTSNIWIKGGMVSINIDWDCDLDYSEKYCIPKYTFHRFDDSKTPIANGWNFRYADYYMVKGVKHRNLIKAYGIQFFISVYGTARKFDLYTFTMNVGSGIGLFSVASLICDIVIFNLLTNRQLYRSAKTDLVEPKDEFHPIKSNRQRCSDSKSLSSSSYEKESSYCMMDKNKA